MNYSQKYFDEIFEQMLNDSLERGLISHADDFKDYINNQQDISNYYVMDKAVIAGMFETFYESLTSVYNSDKVKLAEGTDLDDIGDTVGVLRPQATRASALVTFTLLSTLDIEDGDVNIDEGIVIATDSGIEYLTVEPLYIANGDTEAVVQCLSRDAGIGVKVVENTLTNILSSLEYDFRCTNENGSSGGTGSYDDEKYRDLIMHHRDIKLKGSEYAYREYFASFDGIDGYKLVPNWDVTGTMKIIVDPGTPYLLNQIYNEVQDEISQATEDITLFAPVEKNIDIYALCNVDIDLINPYSAGEKSDIQNKIAANTRIFIDGGYLDDGTYYPGLSIGEDFIPHKLAVFLDQQIPELKNITFNYPEDYVTISDEEQGVANNIVVEML